MHKKKIGHAIAIVGLLSLGINIYININATFNNNIVFAASEKSNSNSSKKNSEKKSSDSSSNSKSNSSDSSGTYSNPTKIPLNEYIKPDHYWAWLQYYGPWAENFGGAESWNGPLTAKNQGCVATSMAIQAARGGMNINPSDINYSQSVGAATSVSKGGMTATRDPATGQSDGSLTLSQALAECKKIASAGKYPIVRVGQKYGGPLATNSHTMAYWKAGNGTPLWYDPSRFADGSVWDTKSKINYVGALTITGKGAKKFSESSPSPSGAGSSGSSSSSSNSSKSGSSSSSDSGASGVQAYKIKPIFNPFYSPSVHYVPADKQVNESQTNAQAMQIADGLGPTALGSLRVFVGFTAYVYAMLAIVAMLIAMVDLQLGGYVQEKVYANAGTMTKGLFFPGGHFMGVDDGTIAASQKPTTRIVINGTKHYSVILIVLTLVASGSMSWIFGNVIMLIANLLGMI